MQELYPTVIFFLLTIYMQSNVAEKYLMLTRHIFPNLTSGMASTVHVVQKFEIGLIDTADR